jgi:cyclophilin family peptidyl-prolyl cis-trans isomerase/HEAT repeat protein
MAAARLVVACAAGAACAASACAGAAAGGGAAAAAAAGEALEASILRAEDERDSRLAPLAALLEAPDPAARARVAVALGRIGDRAHAGLLALRLRVDRDASVRAALCQALGLVGRVEATRALIEALAGDPAIEVRCRAVQALGFIRGPLSLSALLAALPPPGQAVEGPAADLVWHCVVGLHRQRDERAAGALARLAARGRGSVQRAATWGLARLRSARAGPTLRELVSSPDAYVRAWAIRGLGELSAARASDLIPLLSDRSHLVRAHAIVASGSARARAAVPALLRLASGAAGDAILRIEAVNALGAIGDRRALAPVERLRSGRGTLARAADLALARLGVPEKAFLAPPSVPGRHPAGTTAWTVLDWLGWVQALAAHGSRAARDVLWWLAAPPPGPAPGSQASGDDARVVVAAAAGALADSATTSDSARLRALLADGDPYVRGLVVEALAKLDGPAAAGAIAAAYRRALTDPVDDFRTSAVQAAAAWKSPKARPLFEEAGGDPSRNVRVLALRALDDLDAGAGRVRDAGPVGARRSDAFYARAARRALSGDDPVATIVTSAGSFRFRLLARHAPLTVANFIELARAGRFDGLSIPRVVPEFVVQMGDPRGDLSGSPGYTIRCEVNGLAYERGTVGMALAGKDTGGCQFFVTHTRHPHLDGVYTIFGTVISGMDVVDRIRKGDRLVRVEVSDPSGA